MRPAAEVDSDLRPEVCVLTFHTLVDVPRTGHAVSWRSFLHLVDTLEDEGRRVVGSLEREDASSGQIVATFDDGTIDHRRAAVELARRGMSGLFFVTASRIGNPGHLSADDIRSLESCGHVIGSHGLQHVPLRSLPPTNVAKEVRESKERLDTILQADVRYFAPPGGVGHPSLVKELIDAGYSASRSMRWGVYSSYEERWSIPCVPVTQTTVKRGWIDRILETGTLPLEMRVVGRLKDLLPARASRRARTLFGASPGSRAL